MPITMHYVRSLCDKYFLSYYSFSAFCMGRSRYWVMKHGKRVKWDTRRTAAYIASHFQGLNLIFYNGSPKIVIFHELLIVETCNKCHWIWHASNPKYVPLKPFWCIFPSQNQQNVKFGCFLNSPWQKTEKMSICTEKKCLQRLANLHI